MQAKREIPHVSGQASVYIDLPPSRVYTYLLDFSRHGEWSKNLYRVWQTTSGAVAPGTRFRALEGSPPVGFGARLKSMLFFIAGLVQGSRPYSEAEIVALEPDRRISWVGWIRRGQGTFNRVEWEIHLQPSGGGTRLVQHFVYQPQNGAARGMVAALGNAPGIERACAVNLNQLKARLESQRH